MQDTVFAWNHRGWQLGEIFPLKVLACMLRDKDFLKEIFDCLDPIYFSKEDYAILASIILEYFRANGRAPHREDLTILIYDKAKSIDQDGSLGRAATLVGWLSRVFDVNIEDIKLIKDKVREFGRLQSIAHAIQKSIGFLEDTNPKKSGDDVVGKIQDTINLASQVGTDRNSGVFFHDVALEIPRILREDAMYGQESKVPTGIGALDDVLNGGPGAGTMNVVMGPPNRGKTTFLNLLGIAAAQHFSQKALTTGVQKTVVHITCEMSEPDILAKYASGLTGIETNLLIKAEGYVDAIRPRMSQISPINIKFYPPGTPTIDDIFWYVSNLVTVHRLTPGILILDYADKLRGMEEDRYEGMGIIYNRLIEMGHKFGIPIWTGSQINRVESMKKRHSIMGVGESWKKMELCDNAIILNQTEEEHEEGLLILGLGKIRRGSRKGGTINCRVDYGKVKISQLEGEENTAVAEAHSENVNKEPEPLLEMPDIPIDEAVFQKAK